MKLSRWRRRHRNTKRLGDRHEQRLIEHVISLGPRTGPFWLTRDQTTGSVEL